MRLGARFRLTFVAVVLGLAVGVGGCGSEPTAAPTATPGEVAAAPTATVGEAAAAPTATPGEVAATPTATPGEVAAAPTATVGEVAAAPGERATGDVEGIVFVVGEGSEATFSVGEELVNVSLPDYEAVLRTTDLSGEVLLDGGMSVVTVNLHSLASDNEHRDRYVRSRMFPDQRTASVVFDDLTPLPDGFTDGEEAATQVTGVLRINGLEAPLVFDVEARDDGDVVFVLGRSSFTWEQIGEPVPTARSVVSVEDEVRVETLLALRPRL